MKKLSKVVLVLGMTVITLVMSSCGNTTEQRLKTTTSETPEVTTKKSVWEVVDYVDEFGDKTGESTVSALFNDGKFSNSAVVNGKLSVKLTQVNGGLVVRLYEYQTQPNVTLGHKNTFGDITVKYQDGKTEKLEVFNSYKTGLFIKEANPLYGRIMTEGTNETIKISVREDKFSKYGNSTYNFTIQTR